MTDGSGLPLAATVTAGQAHESKQFEALMDAVRPRRRRPTWILGDKGYSVPRIRAWCERRGVFDVIPLRRDELGRGVQRVFSRSIYRGRNVVERCVGWLKHNRRLGLRYEKLATSFLAMVKLAFIRRYLAILEPSDTT